MLAKAHITVGMAAAFTIVRPETVADALPVIAGGALGCLICDLDCENKKERSDSSRWRIAMFAVAAAALIEDHLLDAGMWRTLVQNGYMWCIGLTAFVLTCAFAIASNHRGFSHSLIALALETLSLYLIVPVAAIPFAAAFISHLILDITNYRSVRLFWPAKKGISLGIFYADKLANKVCASMGALWLIIAIIICIRQ